MTTFVLPADRVHESAALCDYLIDRLKSDDTVHAVSTDNEATSPEASRDTEDAHNAIYARLSTIAAVDRHTESADTQTAALRAVAEHTKADEIIVAHATDGVDNERGSHPVVPNSRCPVVVVPVSVE